MKIGCSFSGGGIRGLLSALIAQHIEEQIGRPLWQDADALTGTSTGGILALGICRPDVPENALVVPELVNLYKKHGPTIFGKTRWSAFGGLRSFKYNPTALMLQLTQVLGGATMADARRPASITSYDLFFRRPRFVKSWKKRDRYTTMVTAGMATSAAWPIYFPPHNIIGTGLEAFEEYEEPHPLIDGGFVANNPGMCCFADMSKLYPGEEYTIISFGTGEATKPIAAEHAATGGLIRHGASLIDVLFDAASDAVDYQLRQIPHVRLIRLQPRLTVADSAMDNVSPENLYALEGQAQDFIEDYPELIQQAVDALNQSHAQGG